MSKRAKIKKRVDLSSFWSKTSIHTRNQVSSSKTVNFNIKWALTKQKCPWLYISILKWQLALQLPNRFLSLKMVPKMAILHPIKLQNTKILMENTIWSLKVSKYEPRKWKWSFWHQIIQICKICASAPNRLKAIAENQGCHVE